MKFTITFNTDERDGDNAIQVLETVLLTAANLSVVKTDHGNVVSQQTRPVLSCQNVIDVEYSVIEHEEEVVEEVPEENVESILLVGENIDKLV